MFDDVSHVRGRFDLPHDLAVALLFVILAADGGAPHGRQLDPVLLLEPALELGDVGEKALGGAVQSGGDAVLRSGFSTINVNISICTFMATLPTNANANNSDWLERIKKLLSRET